MFVLPCVLPQDKIYNQASFESLAPCILAILYNYKELVMSKIHFALLPLFFLPPSAYSMLSSTHIEGQGLYFMSQSASSFDGASSRYSDFWSFCDAPNSACNAYNDPDIQQRSSYSGSWRIDSAGSIWASEANIANVGFVQPTLYAFPNADINNGLGAVRYDLTSSIELLTVGPYGQPLPEDRALGFLLRHSFGQYVAPNREGSKSYSVSSNFNEDDIPEGYNSYVETFLNVSFYDSWLGSDGRPNEHRETIINEIFKGDFSTSFSLTNDLTEIVPQSTSDYAGYSIQLESRLVFSPVPLPTSFWLFSSCLIGLFGLRKKLIS